MTEFKIVRHYFNGGKVVIETGLSLEDAQEHCDDPETSSRTCTEEAGLATTRERGPWFDSYTQE